MEPAVAQVIYKNVLMLDVICLVKVTERTHHGFYVESDNQFSLGD